ncbi:MAG: sensor histidine kinase [Clostridia bacterium]|nr:sensor histidine kinase [Clostridia bacterium]
MFEYINLFYIQRGWGICYILTNVVLIFGGVLLLNDTVKTVRGILLKVMECLLCFGVYTLLVSIYYAFFGTNQMDRVSLAVFFLGYSTLRSKYKRRVCLVRGSVYYASIIVMLPLSEPLGELFKNINVSYFAWAQYLTLLVVIMLTGAMIWFLRHFAFEAKSVVHPQFTFLTVSISMLTVICQTAAMAWDTPGSYNRFVCAVLWLINLLAYYMFYVISRITKENVSLLTMRHKAEMELEKYQVTKMNFDELRLIRHEIKNHQFYMKALLEEGKIDQLAEYLERTSMAESGFLKEFDCGNYTLNVILNHSIGAARISGVEMQTEVLVPNQLPFPEEELCSLLCNLLDNAIEAAASSNASKPEVFIRIQPRQDYLFIKLVNSVNDRVTPQRRLSLRTTKANRELHGFGTQIIKRIVDSHNGSIKYSMDKTSTGEHSFVTDVMLELPKEDET